MAGYFKINDQWRQVKTGFRKVNEQWKEMKEGYYNDNGRWVQVLGDYIVPDNILDLCHAYYDINSCWSDTYGTQRAVTNKQVQSFTDQCGGQLLVSTGNDSYADIYYSEYGGYPPYINSASGQTVSISNFDLTELFSLGLPILVGIPNVGVIELEQGSQPPACWTSIAVVKNNNEAYINQAAKIIAAEQVRVWKYNSSLKHFCAKGSTSIKAFRYFDTSRITDMSFMLAYSKTFNVPVPFNTSKVRSMTSMFCDCINFNQPISFDFSSAGYIDGLVMGCTSFNQSLNIIGPNIANMYGAFDGCTSLSIAPRIKAEKANTVTYMFRDVPESVNFNLSDWYVPLVKEKPAKSGFDMTEKYQPRWGQKNPNITPEPPKPLDPIIDPNQNIVP